MTSLLLPSAVALLAHKRLREVSDALQRKVGGDVYDASVVGTGTVAVRDTERRVLALADAAARMFEAGPPIGADPALPVGQSFGRLAIAGSAAFELPLYAELFRTGGSWVAETMRRGTPDPNLSRVVVPSSQFAVRAGELAIRAAAGDPDEARIQSFTMGMLSGLSAAVTVGPLLRSLQAQRSPLDWQPGDPAPDVTAAEREIVDSLFGGPVGAASWQGWWPQPSELPDALWAGYVQALEEAYGLNAHRARGFDAFETVFAAAAPPSLTADRLRSGYALTRLDVQLAAWGTGTWYVALLPALVMPVIGFALVRALPHGRSFLERSAHADERSAWETAMLGVGLGSLPAAGYSIFLWTQVPDNSEAFAEVTAMFALRASLTIAATQDDGAGPGVRWGLLFTPLAFCDVYGLVRGLIERNRGRPAGTVFLLQTIPLATAATVLMSALLADGMVQAGADENVTYAVTLGLLAAGLLVGAGLPLAAALSHSGGLRSILFGERPTVTDALAQLTATSTPAALAALFDDSTLWPDPSAAVPSLADLRYPSGLRPLVRVWWTGSGSLQVAHDEHTVTFKQADGSSKAIVLPPGGSTPAAVAALLMAALPGLQAEPASAADPVYELPFPHTLGDPGDTQATWALHDAHAADFLPVGTSRDAGYLLPHAPRGEQTTGFGANGPSASPVDAIDLVPGPGLGTLEQSAVGLAADLAALLCMGAVPSLAGSAPGAAGQAPAAVKGPITGAPAQGRAPLGAIGPVYEVFRQWNLDERRINEWRTLVQGGAERDQPDPAHADPGMRPAPAGYVNAAQSAAGALGPTPEEIARGMGWIPLWRTWSRMAADITSDTSAATAMSYTPAVPLADGTRVQPSNADLTGAIRYLLDLP